MNMFYLHTAKRPGVLLKRMLASNLKKLSGIMNRFQKNTWSKLLLLLAQPKVTRSLFPGSSFSCILIFVLLFILLNREGLSCSTLLLLSLIMYWIRIYLIPCIITLMSLNILKNG